MSTQKRTQQIYKARCLKQIIVAQNWSVVATQQCNATLVIKMLWVRILLGAGLFLAIYLSVVCPYKDPSRRRNIKNAHNLGNVH